MYPRSGVLLFFKKVTRNVLLPRFADSRRMRGEQHRHQVLEKDFNCSPGVFDDSVFMTSADYAPGDTVIYAAW
jgi:hypothetical protein